MNRLNFTNNLTKKQIEKYYLFLLNSLNLFQNRVCYIPFLNQYLWLYCLIFQVNYSLYDGAIGC